MSKFRRMLIAITAGVHAPFVPAAVEGLRRAGVPSPYTYLGALGLAGLGVWGFLGRAENIANDAHRPWWSTFVVDLLYFWHWCACVFLLVPSVVYTVLEPLVDLVRGEPVGPSFGFYYWTYLLGLVVCGYGITFRRWFFVTRRVEVPIKGLPAALDGYVIAHLSDLHIGAHTPLWWARRWGRAANAAGADLVAVTGDMVTSGVAFHDDIAEMVGELRGRDGVYVVMGNHDYFGEGEPLVTLLRARGVHVLRNEGTVLERDGERLYVAGVDDTWTKRDRIDLAMEARPEGVPSILLQHDPDRFPKAAEHGADLVLAGHTHGGQIALPFFSRYVTASRLAHKFHIGVYKSGDSTLYVHPGLGTTGPPMRLGSAPELVLLTLRAA